MSHPFKEVTINHFRKKINAISDKDKVINHLVDAIIHDHPNHQMNLTFIGPFIVIQGGSNMTGTDVARFTHKSVPVIFEPPCIFL